MHRTTSPRDTYNTVAIWLHWGMALLILVNISLGFGHEWVDRATSRQMMWFHKSIGLTVLFLAVFRLIWRLTHRIPALPDHTPAWEKWAARLSHWALYAVIIALPLVGWLMSSASPRNAPIPFWGLEMFKLPGFADMDTALRKAQTHTYGDRHEQLAWILITLVTIHVLAALKHQFWNKDVVLHHMIPAVKPPSVEARLNADAAAEGREV
jgi:cytochrome b561